MSLTLDDLTPEQSDTTRRDHYGRYKVVPPGGSKPVGYTRATTIAKALDDMHSLVAWKARTAAKGLTLRPELLKMIAITDERKTLDDLVEQAAQAGGATERRDEGTALHRALELHFTGSPVPPMFRADVDAVVRTMDAHGMSVLTGMTERICVLDEHTIAGTFDLIAKIGTTLYVADFKTGKSLDYSGLAFATQLAIYAHADALYTQGPRADGSLDTRDPMPPVDRTVALVLHVQPGSGHCDVHEVDIAYGRRALDLALEVRDARNRGRKLITPHTAAAPVAAAAPATRRDAVVARIKTLRALHPQAGRMLADRWPEGVPMPQSNKLYTRAQFDAIDAVLSDVERAVEAPFPASPAEDAPPLRTPAYAAPTAPVAPVEVRTFDEGADLDADTVAAMLAKLGSLDSEARVWALSVLVAARDSGVPISLRQRPTMRQFELTRAVLAWSALADDDLTRAGLVHIIGDDRVQPGFPLGAVIGALDIDEAATFASMPDRIEAGSLVYVADAQGERLEPVAN